MSKKRISRLSTTATLATLLLALAVLSLPGACGLSGQLASDYGDSTPRTTVKAHANSIDALAYSPQGTLFATGSWLRDPKWGPRGEVKIWDAQGKLQKTLQGHAAAVKSLAFSPDGRTLASGAFDKTLIVFNTRSGAATKLPNRHSAPIVLLSFSPDGRQLLSGDESGTLIFWDVRTLRPVKERFFRGYSGRIRTYAYSWQSDLLASADASQAVMLWKGEQGSPQLLTRNRGLAVSLAFSPDGRLLASANHSDVWLWDAANGNDVSGLVHTAAVGALAFSSDGSILACGQQDGEIMLHQTDDMAGGPASLRHGAKVNVMAFSPAQRGLVSGATDGTLIVWR